MADSLSDSQSLLETWSELIEKTMKGQPALKTSVHSAKESGKDPWIALIDQLWQGNPYSKLLPVDPVEITRAFQQIWIDAVSNSTRTWTNYSDSVQQYSQLMTAAALKFWEAGKDVEPIVAPEKGDKRFSAPDWQQNPVFDAIKQSYLPSTCSIGMRMVRVWPEMRTRSICAIPTWKIISSNPTRLF